MTLTDDDPQRMRFAAFTPLRDGELFKRAGDRLWLDALAPRAKNTKGPFGRARAYARTAAVSHLVIEPGTVRCLIDETTGSAPSSRTYATQPHPTIHIPVLDQGQWRDLTVITRHLAGRLARLPAEDVLEEIAATGARNGIHLLPTFDQCRTSCSCSSRSDLCKHVVTVLLQAARCLDEMPLTLLLLRGRSPVAFFSGLQDLDHPSLRGGPRRLPDPPVASAQAVYDRWQHAARPLPLVPDAPAQPAVPVLPAGVFDPDLLAGLAAGTAQRAHSLLQSLTGAEPTAAVPPEEPGRADAAPVPLPRAQIPLQQHLAELQQATGMTRAQLAEAVRNWGLSD
ncbi:SWIM zinc finger family protein [Streptomyces sp. NPDC048109]|uniref:SWIM zinc finger family protein n=1 Tax=unclassified Streptomyces TaxID=2593676 RepID=UPI003400B232